jgi:hypothetical protein
MLEIPQLIAELALHFQPLALIKPPPIAMPTTIIAS